MTLQLKALLLLVLANMAFSAIRMLDEQQEKMPTALILSAILRPNSFDRFTQSGPMMTPQNMPPQMMLPLPPQMMGTPHPFMSPPPQMMSPEMMLSRRIMESLQQDMPPPPMMMASSHHMSSPPMMPPPPMMMMESPHMMMPPHPLMMAQPQHMPRSAPPQHPMEHPNPSEMDYYDAVKLEDEREYAMKQQRQANLVNNFFKSVRVNKEEPPTMLIESKIPMMPFPALVQPMPSPFSKARPFVAIVRPVPPQEEHPQQEHSTQTEVDGATGEDHPEEVSPVTEEPKTQEETTVVDVPEKTKNEEEEAKTGEDTPSKTDEQQTVQKIDGSVEVADDAQQKDDPMPFPPMAVRFFNR